MGNCMTAFCPDPQTSARGKVQQGKKRLHSDHDLPCPRLLLVSEETVWRTKSGVTVERANSIFWTTLRLGARLCLWSPQEILDLQDDVDNQSAPSEVGKMPGTTPGRCPRAHAGHACITSFHVFLSRNSDMEGIAPGGRRRLNVLQL